MESHGSVVQGWRPRLSCAVTGDLIPAKLQIQQASRIGYRVIYHTAKSEGLLPVHAAYTNTGFNLCTRPANDPPAAACSKGKDAYCSNRMQGPSNSLGRITCCVGDDVQPLTLPLTHSS